jgi:hypothetical protein
VRDAAAETYHLLGGIRWLNPARYARNPALHFDHVFSWRGLR